MNRLWSLFTILAALVLAVACGPSDAEIQATITARIEAAISALPTPPPVINPTAAPTASPTPTPTSQPFAIVEATTIPRPPAGALVLVMRAAQSEIPAYDRSDWQHWVDDDGDCQNARHEVLIEESLSVVGFRDSGKCTVDTGYWIAPFTGTIVRNAGDLDVDHMVPLANAHRSGGWSWSRERKRAYANDLSYPGHLIAVTASANRSKGADGPEEWQPPDQGYSCQYALDWVAIKSEWELSVTEAEWAALDLMLNRCVVRPNIRLTSPSSDSLILLPSPTVTVSTGGALKFDPAGPDRDCGDFDTQAEAQAFFIAAGGPPADPHRLDGNGDGKACEALN